MRNNAPIAIADDAGHMWTRALALSDNEALLDSVTKHRDGYLMADARVARVGTQQYRGFEVGMPDREHVTLYRPAEEVFATDSMRSHANKPVTLTHPKQMVDSKTWGKVAKGFSGSDVVRDGDYVRVPLMLTDAAAIAAYEGGKARELSVGYTTDIDWTAGNAPDGTAYDGVQRDIRTNHHALVPVARGGDRLRLGDGSKTKCADCGGQMKMMNDGPPFCKDCGGTTATRDAGCPNCGGAVTDDTINCPTCGWDLKPLGDDVDMTDAANRDAARRLAEGRRANSGITTRSSVMPITKSFDGVPIQFHDEVSAGAMTREVARMQKLVDDWAAKGKKKDDDDADAVTAQQKKNQNYEDSIKAKDGQIAVLTKQVADATLTDAQIDARITERLGVIDAAKPHLPKEFNPAGKSLGDIRRATVAVSLGDAAVKDWDDAQVRGAFAALTAAGVRKGGATTLADSMSNGMRATEGRFNSTSLADAENEAAKAYGEYVKRLQDGYKTPISSARN